MTAASLPATGRAAAEDDLLSRLGLPPSASPEDVDSLHQAVSAYLATAPTSIRGWAHAQAAALDSAYLQLTDPVGLQGSALRSSTRPPTVEPGGPATPPARRDPRPAAITPVAPTKATKATTTAAPADAVEEIDDDDLEALYASVTPSAHRDMLPGAKPRTRIPAAPLAAATPTSRGGGLRRKLGLGALGVAAAAAILFTGYTLGGSRSPTAVGAGSGTGSSQADASAPAVDEAKIAGLMAKIQANPKDTETLLALADEFYLGEQYDVAASWLDKLLAVEPKNARALVARGAVSFNTNDLPAAEKAWKQVIATEPGNVEAHYDLGFLYLNQSPPDTAAAKREWTKVVELEPGTERAKTVQAHLDALTASPSATGSTGASASGSPSPAASVAAPSSSARP